MEYLSVESARSTIKAALISGEWKQAFFDEEFLRIDELYESEEKVRSSIFFPYGGFFEGQDLEKMCCSCLCAAVDEIALWLTTKRRILRIFYNFNNAVGYTLSASDSPKNDSRRVLLILRKDKRNGDLKYGFFLSTFWVVEENNKEKSI